MRQNSVPIGGVVIPGSSSGSMAAVGPGAGDVALHGPGARDSGWVGSLGARHLPHAGPVA